MIGMSPQPDTGELLAGLVERVTYHNAENGFCVPRARARGCYQDTHGNWVCPGQYQYYR